MENVRAFLLDDHEVVRRGLRFLLEQAPGVEVVGEAGTAAQGRARILELRPDVAVLDVRLPDGSGIDVCRDVRAIDPGVHALVLTSYEDDEALLTAILAGASGYVLKQARGDDLVDSIRRVAAGESLISPGLVDRVTARIRAAETEMAELARLSRREREVLGLVAQGLTNRQIAIRLQLADTTVKTYVSSVLDKLQVERRSQAAVLAQKLLRST